MDLCSSKIKLIIKARNTLSSQKIPLNFVSCVAISFILSGIVNNESFSIKDLEKIQKKYEYYSKIGWEKFIEKYYDWDQYVFKQLSKGVKSITVNKPSFPVSKNRLIKNISDRNYVFLSVLTGLPHQKNCRPITHRIYIKNFNPKKDLITVFSDFDPRMKCILTEKNKRFTNGKNIKRHWIKTVLVFQ